MKIPGQYRIRKGIMASDASYGNNGCFAIPHYKISFYSINCIVSDGMGWQHVSVSLTNEVPGKKIVIVERCPTWEEMCFVKSLFWDDEESVMQLHPPKSMWVNNHPYCLHLWKPDNVELPLPMKDMVGFRDRNTETNKTH